MTHRSLLNQRQMRKCSLQEDMLASVSTWVWCLGSPPEHSPCGDCRVALSKRKHVLISCESLSERVFVYMKLVSFWLIILYFVRYVLTGTIKRNWEYLCSHNKEKLKDGEDKNADSTCEDSEGKFDFSVMSYNILSQDLLEDNSHLYRHCRRPVLHWSFRFPNILKEIKHFDADVSVKPCQSFYSEDSVVVYAFLGSVLVNVVWGGGALVSQVWLPY